MTAEDAVKSIELGAAAIMISNHGGRQLDGAPATVCRLQSCHVIASSVFSCLFL